MKPDALYEFRHIETSTRYILVNHTGEEVADFPATWKVGKNKGKQYIVFRPTVTPPKAGHRYSVIVFHWERSENPNGFLLV